MNDWSVKQKFQIQKAAQAKANAWEKNEKFYEKNPTTQNKTQRISRATPTQITNYFSTTSKAKAEASAKKLPPNEEEPPPPRKPIKSPGFQIIQNYFQTTGEAGNEGYKIQHSQKSHQLLSFVIVVNIILVVFNQWTGNMFGNKALENLHVETFVDHVDPTKPYDGTARAMPTDPIIDIDQDSIEPTTTRQY